MFPLDLSLSAFPFGGVAPPTDPLASQILALYLSGDDVTVGVSSSWPSRASAGSSGTVSMSPHSGGDPLNVSPTIAASGRQCLRFNPTVGVYTGGLLNNSNAPLLGLSGVATFVICGRFVGSVTSAFGHAHNGAVISAYDQQWYVNFDASGYMRAGGFGAGIAMAPDQVAPSSFFYAIIQFSDVDGVRLRTNGGSWSAWSGTGWAPVGASAVYMGFDPTYGDACSVDIGRLWIGNEITDFDKTNEWETIAYNYLNVP